MKLFGRPLGASLLALTALALLLFSSLDIHPADAQTPGANGATYNGNSFIQQGLQSNPPYLIGLANTTSGATPTIISDTSYAPLTASIITFTPRPYDPTVNADYLFATWNYNATKLTSGTGQCGLFANGAIIGNTVQTISFTAGTGLPNIQGDWMVLLTSAGSQVAEIQCKTSDTLTNSMTVVGGQLVVWEVNGAVPGRP